MRTGRKGGAGPAGGRYILIEDYHTLVNSPVYEYALNSPFILKKEEDKYIIHNQNLSFPVSFVPHPSFYQQKTEDGIPFNHIALLHGTDCLATTVYQRCIRWNTSPCQFCGIELSLQSGTTIERKTPEQLLAVARAAHSEGVSHVTLTTGTPNITDKGADLLAVCTSVLSPLLPVHVQVEPVERPYLEMLRGAGAETIGIHIETPDSTLFKKICPGKKFSSYEPAWKHAVELFGDNQVSSYVLVGLGEDPQSMIGGIEFMVQRGIIPYIVPFRPLTGTPLHSHPPPPVAAVSRYARYAAQKMKEYGIDPDKNKAGCVRCGACSPVREYFSSI
jgi:radical SAM protein (TIGR04043 family)